VGGVLDSADYLKTTRFLISANHPQAKTIPASAPEAMQLWDYYRAARGARRLRPAVDGGYSRSLATVFLKNANFIDTARLMSEIRRYEREQLAAMGIRLGPFRWLARSEVEWREWRGSNPHQNQ
jgi:hypothetical protein